MSVWIRRLDPCFCPVVRRLLNRTCQVIAPKGSSSNPRRTKYVDTSRLFLKLFKKRDNGCVDFVQVVSKEAIKFLFMKLLSFFWRRKGIRSYGKSRVMYNLYTVCVRYFLHKCGWTMFCVD